MHIKQKILAFHCLFQLKISGLLEYITDKVYQLI